MKPACLCCAAQRKRSNTSEDTSEKSGGHGGGIVSAETQRKAKPGCQGRPPKPEDLAVVLFLAYHDGRLGTRFWFAQEHAHESGR